MENPKSTPTGLKKGKLPRIAQVLSIKGFMVTTIWTTMELRLNDYSEESITWKENPYLSQLYDQEVFKSAIVADGGLEWPTALHEVPFFEQLGCEQFQPVSFDPDTMYAESTFLTQLDASKQLTALVKNARLAEKLSQKELAIRSGFSKQYINRLENGHSNIQFGSLVQILELGLKKRIDLVDIDEKYVNDALMRSKV